jgi:glutamate/tyrosine decarboxylase-like PLP-dependent enzyme
MAPYQDLVSQLRTAFPAPVSDRLHDAYFVFSFLRALDQVDALKSAAPMLGTPVTLDYDEARRRRVADDPGTLEGVTADLVSYLCGMFIWGHPRAQINVVPSPTIPSIIGGLLPSIYNPNLVSEETSRRVSLAEVEVLAMTAALVGFDPATADGVFTFGGTGTMLYAAKIGLEKAVPGHRRAGLTEPAVLVCSERAHYAAWTVAHWLGIGEDQIVWIPCTDDHQMQIEPLRQRLDEVVAGGRRIACILATMGTTDAFGLDDLEAIVAVRDALVRDRGLDYTPHVHADAVIGWAWSVFNDWKDYSQSIVGQPDSPYLP